jgi:hypothetical protein
MKFLKNTIFFNTPCNDRSNAYFGFHDENIFILVFSEVKAMKDLLNKYEELKENTDIKEMISITDSWVLMSVYSLVRDKSGISKAMEYFINEINET